MCIGSHQAEGRNNTFIMSHTLLKKAILHLKRANGRFILQGTVAKNWKFWIFLVENIDATDLRHFGDI